MKENVNVKKVEDDAASNYAMIGHKNIFFHPSKVEIIPIV